jgi:hypothetical protein
MLPLAYDLMMQGARVIAVLSFGWFSTGAWGANLVSNGGFDGTTYTESFGPVTDVLPSDWNLLPSYPSNTSNINVVPATAYPGFPDPDGGGFYVAFMSQAQNGSEDCLYQDFNTVPGQKYTLSFKAAITSASPYLVLIPDWDELGTDRVKIAVNGFNVNEAATSSSAPLAFQSFTFSGLTASLSTTRLFFHGVDSQGAVLLDSVSVTPDTSPSILWRNSSGDVILWFMSSGTITSTSDLGTIPANWSIVGTGDLNADGYTDILWRDTSTGDVNIWFMNGGVIESSADLGVIPTNWTVAGTGDFNGDGKTDIIWRNGSNADVNIWLMNGASIVSSTDLGIIPSTWTVQGTGDFNADGKVDIVWRDGSTGDVNVWLMNGAAISASTDQGVIPETWTIYGLADFNGDGKSDFLWRNSNGDVNIWFMNGGTITSSADLGIISTTYSIVGTADFNGDAKGDILWRNNTSGDLIVWFMNGSTIASQSDLPAAPPVATWPFVLVQ